MKNALKQTKIAAAIAVATQINTVIAQDQQAPEDSTEVIVVTSQLRAQSLQDVPVAVTAFNEERIERAGIKSSQDFVDLTPNVSLDDSFTYGNTFISIRGVSQINNADSPVAIVVDGVPQNNQKQFKMKLFDIQRIEVLKGPQGSLYGRNAIGGAISIITKPASDDLEGFANVTIGNGGLFDVSGGISGPIVEDTLRYRVAGSFLSKDGLIDNAFLNTKADFVDEDYSIRGNLLYTPNSDLTMDLRVSSSQFDAGSLYDVVTNSTLNPTYRSGGANNFFAPDNSNLGVTEGETDEVTFKLDYAFESSTLTAITNSTSLKEVYFGDLDFSNPQGLGGFQGLFGELRQSQDLDVDLFSQEIRLVSDSDSKLQWIIGGFYIETNRQLTTTAGCDDDPNCAAFLQAAFGLPTAPPNDFAFINRGEDNDNTAWSLFSQVEYILSDKASIQFGARYDRDEREQTDLNNPSAVLSEDFSAFQPKISYNYKYSDDVLMYASYSTGFRSGGFNAPGLNLPTFEDEYLENYELGWKATLSDKLVINSSLFFSQSEDYQFFFVDATTAAQFISNIDGVDIMGFDADFNYKVSEDFTILGGIGLTDTEITDISGPVLTQLASSGVNTANLVGNRTPKNTPVTFNIAFEYQKEIGQFEMLARLDYEYKGKKYWQIDNLDIQDPVDLVNARIGISGEKWSATLWLRNAFDEEYYTDYNPAEFTGSLTDLGFPAQPRSYGIELSYRF